LETLIHLGPDVKVGLNFIFDWKKEQLQHCLETLIQLGAVILVKVMVKFDF
jgi:hypothetical protein